MIDAFDLAILYPWLAGFPALIFAWMWTSCGSRAALAAAILWALYAMWEYSIWAGYSCEGDCNIRVDLLLIVPILLLVSVAAIVRTSLTRRGAKRRDHG